MLSFALLSFDSHMQSRKHLLLPTKKRIKEKLTHTGLLPKSRTFSNSSVSMVEIGRCCLPTSLQRLKARLRTISKTTRSSFSSPMHLLWKKSRWPIQTNQRLFLNSQRKEVQRLTFAVSSYVIIKFIQLRPA